MACRGILEFVCIPGYRERTEGLTGVRISAASQSRSRLDCLSAPAGSLGGPPARFHVIHSFLFFILLSRRSHFGSNLLFRAVSPAFFVLLPQQASQVVEGHKRLNFPFIACQYMLSIVFSLTQQRVPFGLQFQKAPESAQFTI